MIVEVITLDTKTLTTVSVSQNEVIGFPATQQVRFIDQRIQVQDRRTATRLDHQVMAGLDAAKAVSIDAVSANQGVIALVTLQMIGSSASQQQIVTQAAHQPIVALAAIQAVVTLATIKLVIIEPAIQQVIAVSAEQDVVAVTAKQGIHPFKAEQAIRPGSAVQAIRPTTTIQPVIIAASQQGTACIESEQFQLP
ncbi:hypothetical protein D9M68_475400 [compost metagenome]